MSEQLGSAPSHVERGSHYQPSPVVSVVLLVLFVASVALALHSVSAVRVGGNGTVASTSTTTSTTIPVVTKVPRSQVKVQVANGTSVAQLAKTFTDTLLTHNWDALGPINAPLTSATIVYYRSGFEWAAKNVAKEIGAPATSLQPLGGAKPVAGYAGDDVIVILGPNASH